MSEYWVSKKRYFCKYCDVYIADDVPSRQHHENGLRHKGNVERFVRGLYKAGEKRKKDTDEEKREMIRIEQAANAAFAQDVGAGRAQYTASTSSSSPAATSSSRMPRKSGGISDYSTPESLGYTDPDIERARVEAERRRTQGVVGEWQFVESTPTEPPSRTGEEPIQNGGDTQDAADDQETSNKRTAPDPEEDDEGRWKLRKKTATVGLGEIYDPGIIAIKTKTKVEVKGEEAAGQDKQSPSAAGDAKATAVPKWAPVKWKKAGEPADNRDGAMSSALAGDTASTEIATKAAPDPPNADEDVKPILAPAVNMPVKKEPLPAKVEVAVTPSGETGPSQGSLFRKRKAPIGGGVSSRERRF
ncbi:hypothetical protein BJV78DRAFT_463523 [Lactifluus subvellereus]|nr:hypothetical protein BJV78DRAFT_463523 [Lactifluus subvellereus]